MTIQLKHAAVWLLCVMGVGPVVRAAAVDHSAFDAILKSHVKAQQVDYAGIASAALPQLEAYLQALALVDPSPLDRNEQLAYYINLYNANMIKAVIDRNPATFKPSDNDFKVFKEPIVKTLGGVITLDHLENQIIRPKFKDPRIHAALNCAAVSCPAILPRAYNGADLDAVLNENVTNWLNDPTRNQIDSSAKTLKLSKIMDWFAADFGGKDAVPAFIQKYTGKNVSGYKLEYLEYDWTLNKTP